MASGTPTKMETGSAKPSTASSTTAPCPVEPLSSTSASCVWWCVVKTVAVNPPVQLRRHDWRLPGHQSRRRGGLGGACWGCHARLACRCAALAHRQWRCMSAAPCRWWRPPPSMGAPVEASACVDSCCEQTYCKRVDGPAGPGRKADKVFEVAIKIKLCA